MIFLLVLQNTFWYFLKQFTFQELEKVAWFQFFALLLIKQKTKFRKIFFVNYEYFGGSDATSWLQILHDPKFARYKIFKIQILQNSKTEKFVTTDSVSWMPRHCKNGNYIRAQRFIITVFHRSYYCQKLLEIQSCIERLKLWALHYTVLDTMGWNYFFDKHSLSHHVFVYIHTKKNY